MGSAHGRGEERRPVDEPEAESATGSPSVRPIEDRLQDRLERAQTIFEGQLGGLLKQLRTPLKQVEEWVNRGDLQTVVDQLQEKAHRAQEEVERRLHALDEVRQGLEVHVRKQLEELKREREDLNERAAAAAESETVPRPEPAAPQPPRTRVAGPPKSKKARTKKTPKTSGH